MYSLIWMIWSLDSMTFFINTVALWITNTYLRKWRHFPVFSYIMRQSVGSSNWNQGVRNVFLSKRNTALQSCANIYSYQSCISNSKASQLEEAGFMWRQIFVFSLAHPSKRCGINYSRSLCLKEEFHQLTSLKSLTFWLMNTGWLVVCLEISPDISALISGRYDLEVATWEVIHYWVVGLSPHHKKRG